MPLMMSRTSVCAPKPRATPTTPAPAISGPISTPSAESAIMIATAKTTMAMMLRKIGSRVLSRARRRASSSSTGPSLWASASLRSMIARRIRQIRSATRPITTALARPRVRRVHTESPA